MDTTPASAIALPASASTDVGAGGVLGQSPSSAGPRRPPETALRASHAFRAGLAAALATPGAGDDHPPIGVPPSSFGEGVGAGAPLPPPPPPPPKPPAVPAAPGITRAHLDRKRRAISQKVLKKMKSKLVSRGQQQAHYGSLFDKVLLKNYVHIENRALLNALIDLSYIKTSGLLSGGAGAVVEQSKEESTSYVLVPERKHVMYAELVAGQGDGL